VFSLNCHRTILGNKAVAICIATAFLSTPLAAQPFAYISNQLDDSVSVIDTATGGVVETEIKEKKTGSL